MSKKIKWVLLSTASIILLIITFICCIVLNIRHENSVQYYNISASPSSNIISITQKQQWLKPINTFKELLVKKKITATFRASVDNLGIISIPFNTRNRSINDRIVFRLKKTGERFWYFQSIYNSNQIQNDIPFPFGFPVLTNSNYKSYTFEIESLNGTFKDSLMLSKKNPYFLTKYKFSKSELVRNPINLSQFLVAKIIEQLPFITIRQILFILLISLSPFIIATFWKNHNRINVTKLNIFSFILNNSVTILIGFLLLIIATSTFYNYVNPPLTYSTMSRFNAAIGNDFYLGVQYRASQMVKGQKMDLTVILPNYNDPSGQVLPLLFSPFLILKPNPYAAYFFFICIAIMLFTLFFIILIRKSDKEIRNGALIFMIAFFLTEPGLLGIHTGNIDIILAPLLGILILLILNLMEKKSISHIQAISIGIFAGFVLNMKLTLLPFVLIIVLFSKRTYLTFLATLMMFLTLIYIPNIFGSESSLQYHLSNVMGAYKLYSHLGSLTPLNHSLVNIASFFSRCIELNTCDTQNINTYISLIFFVLTFVTPFLLVRPITKIIITKKNIHSILKYLNNKETALVLLALSDGLINLSFKTAAFDYRLYLSIPIVLIILKESQKVKRALIYCYLSMFSLLLGGIWVMQLAPNEAFTIDARLIKIFIIFHFFFLLLSTLTYWKESQNKTVVIKNRISKAKI